MIHFKDNKNKSALSTRWAQMTKQEQIIEKKKMEIQAKLESQKQAAALAAQAKLANICNQDEKSSANIFSNDGSFMSQFKALLEKQKQEKKEQEELENKKREEEEWKAREAQKAVEILENETREETEHPAEIEERPRERSRERHRRDRWGDRSRNRGHSPMTPVVEDRKKQTDNKSIPSLMHIPMRPPGDGDNPETANPWPNFQGHHDSSNDSFQDQDSRDSGPPCPPGATMGTWGPGPNMQGPGPMGPGPMMGLGPLGSGPGMPGPPMPPGTNMGPNGPNMGPGPGPNMSQGPNMGPNMGHGPNMGPGQNMGHGPNMGPGSNMGPGPMGSRSGMGPGPMSHMPPMPPNGPGGPMPPNGPGGPMPPFMGGPPNYPMPPNFMGPNGPCGPGPMPPNMCGPNMRGPGPNGPMPPFCPPFPNPPYMRPNGPPMPPNSNGSMPFMGPRPPFGPNGPNFGPNGPQNMPFMPPNSMPPNMPMPNMSEQKPLDTIPPPEPMKLQNIPPPMPLPLNHIPKPKDLDPGNIPAPPQSLQVLSSDFPPAVHRAAAEVAVNGDHWENVLKAIHSQDQNMWFLHNPNSGEYKAFRELVQKHRDEKKPEVKPEDKYEPEFCLDDDSNDDKPNVKEEGMLFNNTDSNSQTRWEQYPYEHSIKREAASSQSDEEPEAKRERRKRKKSRWGADPPADIKPPGVVAPLPGLPVQGIQLGKIDDAGVKLTAMNRNNPALLQYAQMNFGSTNLSPEDWKKCEDNFKLNLLYQDMMKKRQEVERLAAQGKHKYEYDSDEDTAEGTWEHKLRAKEMNATEKWADELTKQAAGKHHIGDFLPPEELKKFMEKYSALKGGGREPDLSDYKEFKLKEDNVGFKMLQKLGWNEGQGLGAEGTGIVDPINKPKQVANLGLGAAVSDAVSPDDDEFDAYRKRMMLAYRFRPNPLNNPRRPYY